MSENPEPPSPVPIRTRRAQKKMSPEDRTMLDEILKRPDVRIDGKLHLPTVASLAGLSYQQVYGYVRNNAYLAAQVGEADPSKLVPVESNLVDNDDGQVQVGVTITDSQMREYQALIRQNRKMMAKDWEALGMTEEAGKRMEHYVKLGTTPSSMILRASTGQLISNLELLDRVVKRDAEMILSEKIPTEYDKEGNPVEPDKVERQWRHTVYEGMKLQLNMFSHLHKAQALMARVMADLHKMNGGAPPAAKGTFEMAPVSSVSDRE